MCHDINGVNNIAAFIEIDEHCKSRHWKIAEELCYTWVKRDRDVAIRLFDRLLNNMGMVFIEAGFFIKGINPEQLEELRLELGERLSPEMKRILQTSGEEKVMLDAYFIDIYPVTNKDFTNFYNEEKHITEAERIKHTPKWRDFYDPENPDKKMAMHPVVCVTQKDAEAYAAWMNKELPSADQWEKAARGPKGSLYPWQKQYRQDFPCNSKETKLDGTSRVDKYKNGISPYGVFDMVGNVSEWTKNVDENKLTIVMGGSYLMDNILFGLPAFRYGRGKKIIRRDFGFRCALKASHHWRP